MPLKPHLQRRVDAGLCYQCDNLALPGMRRCKYHSDTRKESRKKLYDSRKSKGVCVDCTDIAVHGLYCNKHKGTKKLAFLKDTQCRKKRLYVKTRELESRFKRAKFEATNRRCLEWTITEDQFCDLANRMCFYCRLANTVETGSGLDRIDNNKGYHTNNVVSCCKECNVARMNNYTIEEMELIGQAIRAIKINRIIKSFIIKIEWSFN